MRPKIILMGIVAAAVLAVGCGGGDNGGSASTGTNSGATSSTTTNTNAESGANDGQEDGGSTTQSEAKTGGGDGGSTSESEAATGDEEGGSSTQSEAATGPLSKKGFIAAGDAICEKVPKRYTAKLKALGKKSQTQGNPEPSTAEANLKAAVPPLYLAIEELERLSPPPGEEQRIEAIVDSLDAAVKGLEKKPSAPLAGPKSPFAEFQKLTKEYGFKVCFNL